MTSDFHCRDWVQKPDLKRPYDSTDSAWLCHSDNNPFKKSRNDVWPGHELSTFPQLVDSQPIASCGIADASCQSFGWNPDDVINPTVDLVTDSSWSGSDQSPSGSNHARNPIPHTNVDHQGEALVASIDYRQCGNEDITQRMDIDDTSASEPSNSINVQPNEVAANTIASEDHHLQIDCCFGVIHVVDVMMDFPVSKARKTQREVEIEVNPGFVKLRDQQSKRFLGILPPDIARVLLPLSQKYHTTFAAVSSDTTTLAITLSGSAHHSVSVGRLLSQKGYFLQPPEEDDLSVPYINPQVLLPPGADFRHWHTSSEMRKTDQPSQASKVSSTTKSRIVKVFDDASGPSEFNKVCASNRLRTELKPHQEKALSMMIEKESGNLMNPQFPSVWIETTSKTGRTTFKNTVTGTARAERPKLCLGGLLADDMGLGKTLTALALVAGSASTVSSHAKSPERTTLIITLLSNVTTWEEEIEKHFQPDSIKFFVYHGPGRTKCGANIKSFDIILTTYDTVKADFCKATKPNDAGAVSLFDNYWHRVILDEAHTIRTRKTKVFQAACALQAQHRWCLTGTPIQNSIEDLGSLVSFLRVAPFDDAATFKNRFVTPILKQEPRGWDRLTALVKAISLRRVKGAEEGNLRLPPKTVVIEPVRLSPKEAAIYDIFVRSLTLGIQCAGSESSLFQAILRLRQISNHGSDLLPGPMQEYLARALRSADTSSCGLLTMQTCESCDRTMGTCEDSTQLLPCLHSICKQCTAVTEGNGRPDRLACPICSEDTTRTELQDHPSQALPEYLPSSKVMALLMRLEGAGYDSSGAPIKSLVYSSWTKMLDMLEIAFYRRGLRYQRIDGRKTLPQRRDALNQFKNDSSCTILLASIGSAAVGLDLTVASQVHLVEPSWNPMLELQALDRVHRLGQTKPVKAFRYVIDSETSIEQHMIRVQERKLQLMSSSFQDYASDDQGLRESITDFTDILQKGNHSTRVF